MIEKIGQMAIPVKNLVRAIDFYKEKLDLPLLFNMDHLAFFECNGVRLLLSVPESEEFANASSVIYFHVSDINKSYQELTAKNVHFIDEPHLIAKMGQTETWMAFFNDTEGNTHALMSEILV